MRIININGKIIHQKPKKILNKYDLLLHKFINTEVSLKYSSFFKIKYLNGSLVITIRMCLAF